MIVARKIRSGARLLGALAISTGLAGAAFAMPESGSLHDLPIAERQEILQEAVDAALAEVEALGSRSGNQLIAEGLNLIVADESLTTVTLYWKGSIPAPLERLQEQPPLGLDVRLVPAQYTQQDFIEISAAVNSSWQPEWGEFQGFAPPFEGGHVGATWRTGKVSRNDVLAELRKLTALPELYDWGEQEGHETASRWNDWSQWNGGGALSGGGTVCSSSFGVNTTNGQRILTAAHCFASGDDVFDGTGAELVGAVSFRSTSHDYEMVNGDPSTTVFIGTDEDENPGQTRLVNNPGSNIIGTDVCTSGANSGQHCNLRIGASLTDDNGWYTYLTDPGSGIAVVGGDSGGPVMSIGNPWAGPRGVITHGWTTRACTSADWHVNPGYSSGGGWVSGCWARVQYIPIQTILNHHNATIVKNP